MKTANLKTKKAYSILEVIVSLVIIGFAMIILFNFLILSLKLSITSLARSFTREEISTIANLVERDLRNADYITGCGGSTPQATCQFYSKGEVYTWQICTGSPNQVCKVKTTTSGTETVFQSSNTVIIRSFLFEKGFTEATANEKLKINTLLTIVADHSKPEYKIQNVIRQLSISTRNFNVQN